MPNVVRVFRATVKPGKQDEFRSFFLNDAVPMLRTFDGLISVQVGLPREESPRDFLMTTVWKSVEALAEFSGESWREAVIDPREEHLLEAVHVHHFEEAALVSGGSRG